MKTGNSPYQKNYGIAFIFCILVARCNVAHYKSTCILGFIELITESETLRKIQVSSGVTGSFKDRPIKDWLQKHNPTELDYQKVHLYAPVKKFGRCELLLKIVFFFFSRVVVLSF